MDKFGHRTIRYGKSVDLTGFLLYGVDCGHISTIIMHAYKNKH